MADIEIVPVTLYDMDWADMAISESLKRGNPVLARSKEEIKRLIERGNLLKALYHDAGSSNAGLITLEECDGIAELRTLCVPEEYAHRGIGQRLIESLVTLACNNGYEKLYLFASERERGGKTLVEFYAGLGFHDLGKFLKEGKVNEKEIISNLSAIGHPEWYPDLQTKLLNYCYGCQKYQKNLCDEHAMVKIF